MNHETRVNHHLSSNYKVGVINTNFFYVQPFIIAYDGLFVHLNRLS
jgi:hypothetical protein